jgi:hypothetical protein
MATKEQYRSCLRVAAEPDKIVPGHQLDFYGLSESTHYPDRNFSCSGRIEIKLLIAFQGIAESGKSIEADLELRIEKWIEVWRLN